VPTTMRQRLSGTSKKGDNLIYGLRYARVIARTWWRESRAARHNPRQPPGPAGKAAEGPVSAPATDGKQSSPG
ncbi:MAG TPA: hypothetical protein VGI64_03390, partial [Streptosporangiaceae bacterium]